ncbi:MAG: ABC transporter permease [Gemmatimonadaceae bacterium]|nr:ABC transporter permease [Gemmatimonadaceae bacterium]
MLIHRGAESLLLFWLVVSLTFLLAHLAPGDAADLLVSPSASPEEVTSLRRTLGLDASLPVQYVRWVGGVLRGDLGESFALREPVVRVIARALPISLALGLTSLVLTFVVGVSVGLFQAARRGHWQDRVLTGIGITIFAAPSYWLALALVALFTTGASWWGFPDWLRLPAFGIRSPASTAAGWDAAREVIRHALLPVTVLAAIGAAGIARYARAAALDLAGSDWVRTARAKGVVERRVMGRHLLANAVPPLVVLFALSVPGVVAGSVFVEGIFAWPGMGRLMLAAIAARDYPVVMGATLVYAALVLIANGLADMTLYLLDPRRR